MGICVLIVDDSLPMRAVIKKTFKAAGYAGSEFLEAENGEHALAVMEENWVDIVITDFNMPVMNGLELIKRMKENDLFEKIPVIVISTEGSEEKIDQFMSQGADGFIRKPFEPEDLRDILIQILGAGEDHGNADASSDGFDF